jgi:antitoxin VapB
MDGDLPLRITQDGDHQVVHLPAGVSIPEGSILREQGSGRYVIEPSTPKASTLAELLRKWAAEGPLAPEDQMPPIERPPARPFDF